MKEMLRNTQVLLELLGHDEEPFGVFYTDNKPEEGYAPKKGELFSREREAAGQIDWGKAFENFSCIIGNIWLARKKKKAAWISFEQCGCMGGGFYSGMYSPYLEYNIAYVSTGIPGTPVEGEHYLPSPESMRAFMDDCSPRRAPGKYGVMQPLSRFQDSGLPEVVVFFARPEVMTGLHTLACFASGSHVSVVSPFGAGCTNILTWPLTYKARGEEKAVLGGFDPSARKYLKVDELTLAIPADLYGKMLETMRDSALTRHTWEGVRKKVLKSRKTWSKA